MSTGSKFLIYALVDPRDGQWRYVGKSVSGLKRPKEHLYPSFLRKHDHKNAWIKSLLAIGLEPQIEVLEELAGPERLSEAEIEWIAECKRQGVSLTNLTDGGEGLLGRLRTEDEIGRIRLGNMESKRHITIAQEAELCDLYRAGTTTYELAVKFGMDRHSVSRWLRKNDVTVRPKTLASRRKVMPDQTDEMVELYVGGMSTPDLAKRYGTYPSNIFGQLKQRGVVRSRSEAQLKFHQKQVS